MRKIKIEKDYTLTNDLILDLLKKHSTEKSRLEKLLRYYNNENDKINNRVYKKSVYKVWWDNVVRPYQEPVPYYW